MAKPTLEQALEFAIEWLGTYEAEEEAAATADLAVGDQNGPQRDLAVAYLQRQLARLRSEAMVRDLVRRGIMPMAARGMVREAIRQARASRA